MNSFRITLVLLSIINFTSCAIISRSTASYSEVEIVTVNNSKREERAKSLLIQQLKQYDLSKYTFTKTIRIQERVIPHSHPVLTLNTRLIEKPNTFLSTYLHEQIHWHLADKSLKKSVERFISKMKELYPKVPVGEAAGGAKDKLSTYRHLGVNLLEYDALRYYIGNRKAKDVFLNKKIYRWVNKTVLNDYLKIRKELDQLGLVIENKNVSSVYDDLLNYDEEIRKRKNDFSGVQINLQNINDAKK